VKNSIYDENYLKFLEMDERKSELDVKPEWGDISLENVSFSYPNSEAYAVKNANFTLMNGETIAIVGENGSGKSTLVRLLDEPTAAIDPYEETRIYNRFAEISKDKSAIIVTHRLGAAKIADRIVVMKDGEIEEIGTHDELIQARKEYTRLYTYQEQWYS
jgi:ATP-binding cassette subfamily B protein